MSNKLDVQAQEFGFNTAKDLETYALGLVENAKSIGPFEGLAKTALFSAVPGFVGGSPSAALQGWQARHPVASTVGTIGGMLVPYVGAAKALSATKLPGLIEGAMTSEKSGAFAKGAAKMMSYDIPIETGRFVGGAIAGQPVAQAFGGDYQGVIPSAEEAVMNIGTGAVLGGGIGMLADSGRSFIKEAGMTAGLPINKQAPFQEQGKEIQKLIDTNVISLSRGRLAMNELRDKIFAQEPQAAAIFGDITKGNPIAGGADLGLSKNKEKRFVHALDGVEKQSAVDNLNHKVFKVSPDPKHNTKKLTSRELEGQKEIHFSKVSPVLTADNPNWIFDVGMPRVVAVNQERSNVAPVMGYIERALKKVDDNYYQGYDPVQKMYILARKLPKNGKHLTDKTTKVGDPFVILFKTDKPENFIPGMKGFKEQRTRTDSFMDDGLLKRELSENYKDPITGEAWQNDIHDEAVRVYNLLQDSTDFIGLGGKAKDIEDTWIRKLENKTGVHITDSTVLNGMKTFARDYLTPTMHALKDPLASKIHMVAKVTMDTADRIANDMVFGKAKLGKKNLYKVLSIASTRDLDPDSLAAKVLNVWDTKLAKPLEINVDIPNTGKTFKRTLETKGHQLMEAIRRDFILSNEDFAKLGITKGDDVWQVMEMLRKLDYQQVKQIKAIENLYGRVDTGFNPRINHYMFRHRWDGKYMMTVYDKTGEFSDVNNPLAVYTGSKDELKELAQMMRDNFTGDYNLGGGKVLKEIEISEPKMSNANLAHEAMRKIGNNYRPKNVLEYTNKTKLLDYVESLAQPRAFKERKGYTGFTIPKTAGEFLENIHGTLQHNNHYMARNVIAEQLGSDMQSLMSYNPQLALKLSDVMDTLQGRLNSTGMFSPVAVNEATDKLLSPILGKNSADKLANGLNRYMHTMSLGFMNLSYVMANAMQFMQTTLPHISWLTTGDVEKLHNAYPSVPLENFAKLRDKLAWEGKGKNSPQGLMSNTVIFGKNSGNVLSYLDGMKVAGRAAKELAHPRAEFLDSFSRAINDGTISPQFTEAFMGEKGEVAHEIRNAFQKTGGLLNVVKTAANFLPATTEEITRGHSFMMGNIIGKDVMGLNGDSLYNFAKNFTKYTMYEYTSSGRAPILTGPIGRTFGLFKNWVMHYLFDQLRYAGEGVKRGQWQPLLWSMGTNAGLGGLGALPFIGAVDGFAKWLTDKNIMQNLYGAFGEDQQWAADGVYYGLPAFLGFSLQSQVAAPFSDPANDASRFMQFAMLQRIQALSKGLGEAWDTYTVRGENPLDSQRVQMYLMKGLAPKNLQRYFSLTEDNAIKSMQTGNPIVKNLSLPDKLWYTMGMNPVDIERAFEVNNAMWTDHQARQAAITTYGQNLFDLIQEGSIEEAKKVLVRAAMSGIDINKLLGSIKSREYRQTKVTSELFGPDVTIPYRDAGLIPQGAEDVEPATAPSPSVM